MMPSNPPPTRKELEPRKYQDGKLEIRSDVGHPYYFVRVTKPRLDADGVHRKARVKVPIGFVDQITKREAMVARAKILKDVNSRRMLAQADLRFEEMAKRFIEVRVPQLGVAVQQRYPSQLKNHLIPWFGKMTLSEIDRPAIEQFLNEKKAAGLAPWSLIGLKGLLSAVFTVAKGWRLFEGENPCVGIRVKKRTVREKRLLTGEQLLAILAALDERERFLVQVLLGLGLRISECLGLKWSDVDLDAGTVQIRRRWYRGSVEAATKSEAGERTLQLGAFLAGEFERRREAHKPDEFVFAERYGTLPLDDRDLLRYYFRPIVKRIGLHYPGFGWHAFRRQNITMRQHYGATAIEAMKAAGHTSVSMTALYTLPDAVRERAQVDAMFSALAPKDEDEGWGMQ